MADVEGSARGSDFCHDLALHNSLVAFVASAFVHTKIVTAGRRNTCGFWQLKVLRARVQLLQLLPFRPEIEPSYELAKEQSQRAETRKTHAQMQRNMTSGLYPRQSQLSAVKSGKSADFL
jgi:hypothetical protein